MGLRHWFRKWQGVSARRQAEHQERERALLASIVESADDAIISKTLEGRVTSWNIGAEHLFGYRAEEVLGQPISTIIPPEVQEEEQRILARLRRGECIGPYETVRLRKDGSRVEVSLRISPTRDAQGRLSGASKVARDITRQKQAERDLLRAQTELTRRKEDLEREVAARTAALTETIQHLESFAYTVSHDLRAPLRAIKGLTVALHEDYDHLYDQTGKDYARRVVEAAERLEHLIAALLAYSRIGKGEIPVVQVELADYLPRLREHWAGELQAHGAELEIAPRLPPVLANPTLLDQALTNLVFNAVKFVGPGSVPRVEISAEAFDGMVRLRVRDNGIGIEPSQCQKLFQVFQRLHSAEKYPGLGLGLVIVRKATERMGGRVGVESELGKGSCFWIELPAAP